jgi:hypothetical protein
MSDEVPTTDDVAAEVNVDMAEDAKQAGSNIVALVAIIATAFVIIVCIFACALVLYAFFQNAPW